MGFIQEGRDQQALRKDVADLIGSALKGPVLLKPGLPCFQRGEKGGCGEEWGCEKGGRRRGDI